MNDGASVVLLSSNVETTSKPNSSIYQASKAALNSIAKVAKTVIYLSDNHVARFMTGTEILIDGGMVL